MSALAVLNGLSTFVKVGWLVWLVWCAAQGVWYRLGRSGRAAHVTARRSSFGLGLTRDTFDSPEVAKASRKIRRSGRRESVVDDQSPVAVLQ